MLYEFAPAKLNLYLHITGRRPDGYHDLDSLVAFAGVGDEIRLEAAGLFEFHIEGPQAKNLAHDASDNNLVVKAATTLAQLTGKTLNVKITLVKNLPVASGIGGGSADAAAVLRILAKHWGLDPQDPRLLEAAGKHGQDVPLCVRPESGYLTAAGHSKAPELPYADIVLLNPQKGLSTADVYNHYKDKSSAFSAAMPLKETPQNLADLVTALKSRHNDLYFSAADILHDIPKLLKALTQSKECLFAQMSGSGATCFGIYGDRRSAREAAAEILQAHPDWWVVQSYIPCRSDPRQRF